MEGYRFLDQQVFPYRTMLFSSSPLLQEIYVDSHRFEPWAVLGRMEPVGRVPFARVLYLDAAERQRLLDDIVVRLDDHPAYADEVEARFRQCLRTLVTSRRVARRWLHSPTTPVPVVAIEALIDTAARVLAPGIFKEVLSVDDVTAWLERVMPVRPLRASLMSLYQPLCLPHFMVFELRLLGGAARLSTGEPSADVVRATIDRCAHLARFQLERHELHDDGVMHDRLSSLVDHHGGTEGLQAAIAAAHHRHHHAISTAIAAGDLVRRVARHAGPGTFRQRRRVHGFVRMLHLVATLEELKHTAALEAVSTLRAVIETLDLQVESTDRRTLLGACHSAAEFASSIHRSTP